VAVVAAGWASGRWAKEKISQGLGLKHLDEEEAACKADEAEQAMDGGGSQVHARDSPTHRLLYLGHLSFFAFSLLPNFIPSSQVGFGLLGDFTPPTEGKTLVSMLSMAGYYRYAHPPHRLILFSFLLYSVLYLCNVYFLRSIRPPISCTSWDAGDRGGCTAWIMAS
jgi:hypothetical protein